VVHLRVPLLCSIGDPWWLFVQTSTEIEGGFKERLLGRPGPEVKMISRSPALETAEHVAAKVRRKGAVFSSLRRFMEWTFPSHLVARSLSDDKSQQLQNLRHRYIGSELPEIDRWHDRLKKEQRRGTRISSSYRRDY
jgi:hypothetical protein